jgi:quercetin dioxygenase-like cupin family protein
MNEFEHSRWFPIVAGIRRRTVALGDRMMQMYVELEEGAILPEHRHPHEQMSYIISGRLRFMVGGDVRDLGPGAAVTIPGNTAHAVEVLEAALVIDTFSPPREDLLAQDRGAG